MDRRNGGVRRTRSRGYPIGASRRRWRFPSATAESVCRARCRRPTHPDHRATGCRRRVAPAPAGHASSAGGTMPQCSVACSVARSPGHRRRSAPRRADSDCRRRVAARSFGPPREPVPVPGSQAAREYRADSATAARPAVGPEKTDGSSRTHGYCRKSAVGRRCPR